MSQPTIVSVRAVMQRLNAALASEDGTRVRKSRPGVEQQLGEYFALDVNNTVTAAHIDLETWARDAGVMNPHEGLARS